MRLLTRLMFLPARSCAGQSVQEFTPPTPPTPPTPQSILIEIAEPRVDVTDRRR